PLRPVSSGSHLCRPYLKGRQAGRSARRTADEVRVGHQSQDRRRPWTYDPAATLHLRRRGDRIRRREFITLLSGAVVAWPLVAREQPVKTLPTIGFLGASTSLNWTHWTNAFMRRLGELGWIDGRTVTIEYRWAEGRSERFAEIAAEFVRLKVD